MEISGSRFQLLPTTLNVLSIKSFGKSHPGLFSHSTMPSSLPRPQCCSVAQSCLTLCDPMDCSMSGFPVHHQLWSLLKLMSIGLMMPTKHLILCRPLLLLSSVFPSIRVFSNESVIHIRWPKYLSFSSSISPSNEYSGLNSFRTDWIKSTLLSFLGVLVTLKSLLQYYR